MKPTRRDFLRTSSILSASAAAMTLSTAQLAHGAGTDETIKAVVVGCGGRGRGAVANFNASLFSNARRLEEFTVFVQSKCQSQADEERVAREGDGVLQIQRYNSCMAIPRIPSLHFSFFRQNFACITYFQP